MAPYVTSKAAGDALAETTAFEISQLGIEATIVLPGALTEGTQHFPDATTPADHATTAAYAALDPPGMDASPDAVGREIVRLLAVSVRTGLLLSSSRSGWSVG